MLENKTAVIYGGGGAVGGTVARALAEAGARVHLAGRSRARLDEVASAIGAAGVAEVDALDEIAVADHAAAVAAEAQADAEAGAGTGGIDIALNAVSFPFAHDTPFAELTVDEVMHPIDAYLRTNLVTTKAVARHMTQRRSGTILTLSAGAARVAPPGSLGYGTACAAIETLTQRLAVELGPSGVRIVCLRPHLIADAPAHGSYTRDLVGRRAEAAGVGVDEWLGQWQPNVTLLGRLPTLAQVAATAVFLASDHAAAITGTVVDVTGGNALRTAAGALVGLLD
jgi:NAD(P)-dependent dehydrogenase (short-subunit alcohol dehydrogenase family)